MADIIITLYPILCVLLPCLIYMFIRARKPGKHLTKAHFIWVFLFVFYLHMVLDTTGIGTIWDIGKYDSILSLDKINLIPFNDGLELSCSCHLDFSCRCSGAITVHSLESFWPEPAILFPSKSASYLTTGLPILMT